MTTTTTSTTASRSRRVLLTTALLTVGFAVVAPSAQAMPPLPPVSTMCIVVPPNSAPVIGYTPGVDRCIPWPGADQQ